eukprot:GHVU01221157.1.p1 GENE.GHVU01221157.1~~GHVU01221157.1.p1  ORF type:complete len:169 (-),score=1.84 GHVU01221157.1:494-1000(-)
MSSRATITHKRVRLHDAQCRRSLDFTVQPHSPSADPVRIDLKLGHHEHVHAQPSITCIHAFTHKCTYTHVHTHTHKCTCTYAHTHTHRLNDHCHCGTYIHCGRHRMATLISGRRRHPSVDSPENGLVYQRECLSHTPGVVTGVGRGSQSVSQMRREEGTTHTYVHMLT